MNRDKETSPQYRESLLNYLRLNGMTSAPVLAAYFHYTVRYTQKALKQELLAGTVQMVKLKSQGRKGRRFAWRLVEEVAE